MTWEKGDKQKPFNFCVLPRPRHQLFLCTRVSRMFPRQVVFGQSVFSPERPPTIIRYVVTGKGATKKAIKPTAAKSHKAEEIAKAGRGQLEEEERAAQEMTTRAAEAAAKARATNRPVDSGARPTPRRTAAAPGDMQAAAAPGMEEADALAREKRAKYRFLVERLLDAAKAGTNKLDALLREERARLNREFFEHMRWEVEEQTKAKNRRMLDILEVVVQRACIEVEEGRTEVALLSALLQTRNPTARSEMYERELALTSPRVQAAFAQLVRETQLELEKAVMRGQQVDGELLQMLRVISAEATNHIALP